MQESEPVENAITAMDDSADDCPHPSGASYTSARAPSSSPSAILTTGRNSSGTTTMIIEERQQQQSTEEITNDVLILSLQPRPTVTW
jgi:hypothetical protein